MFILNLILKSMTLTWKRDEEQSGFFGGKGSLLCNQVQISEVKKEKGMREMSFQLQLEFRSLDKDR